MKNINHLIKERGEILGTTRRDYITEREYTKACNRLALLNLCIYYLESEPTIEFLLKEVARLEHRIEKIYDGQPVFKTTDNRNEKEEKKIIKKYLDEYKVPELKTQLKTIKFLLT